MASSSLGGTPSASDVRRARAARFSISPVQGFASPSFSLDLETFPRPPTFDDCGEKDLEQGDEKQSSKRIRLLNDKVVPSFSLGLEDIQAPPPSKDFRRKASLDSGRQACMQGQETRRGGICVSLSGRGNTFPSSKRNKCSGTDSLKTAEECRNNQGRASEVFSGPSFSLGLERSSSPAKSDDACGREKKQASDRIQAYGGHSTYPSSGQCRGGDPSSSKSRQSQVSREDHLEVLKGTFLHDSHNENSSGLKCGVTLKCSGEVTPKHRKLLSGIPPPSPSLFQQKIDRSPKPKPLVRSFEEQAPKRFGGLSPPPKLTGHAKTEPADATRRTKGKEISPSSRSGSSSRSHADQILQGTPNKDGSSSSPRSEKQSADPKVEGFIRRRFLSNDGEHKLDKPLTRCREFKTAGSTNDATTVSQEPRVGPISKTEEVEECEGDIGEHLASSLSHTHCPPIIYLSPEQLKRRQGVSKDSQGTWEQKTHVESEVDGQHIKEEVDVVDLIQGRIGEHLASSLSHTHCPPIIYLSPDQVNRRQGGSKDSQDTWEQKTHVESEVDGQHIKEEVDVVDLIQGSIGEHLPSSLSHTHCPPIIYLSPDQVNRRQSGSKDGQGTCEQKIHVESEVDGQHVKEEVDVVDLSTPPSSLRLASRLPLRRSYGCSESEIVQDSENELDFDCIHKRRRLSKPCTQVKAGPPSTSCLEDSDCLPVDRERVADKRTLDPPVAEQKKNFKRLRRGSSSARKNSPVSQAPQDGIDRCGELESESSDPSFNPNKKVQTSVDDSKKQMPDSSQRTKQDEFDDIEDFSEHELPCSGSRSHRGRRSLNILIPPKKLSLSSPSPVGGKKPVLHIPGLDTSVISEGLCKAKAEPVTCLETKFVSVNIVKKCGNVKSEPISLSDDEEPGLERSKVFSSQTLSPEVVKRSGSIFQKEKLVPNPERARSDDRGRGSSWKGKSPVMDGSDLWKSYPGDSLGGGAGPGEGLAGTISGLYKMCQSSDFRIADLLCERLPHFKPVDALLLDGGLDQEPVYIDYRNQFGRSQGMDSAAFAELDCTQPHSRRNQKRSSSKSTKARKSNASSSTANSSQRTTAGKGKRKAWTLFRQTKGRASASGSPAGKGHWIMENGRRVYVKDGQQLTGRIAYAAYKKDSGKKSRRTKKPAKRAKL